MKVLRDSLSAFLLAGAVLVVVGLAGPSPVQMSGAERRENGIRTFRNTLGMLMVELPGVSVRAGLDVPRNAQGAGPVIYMSAMETTNAQYRTFLRESGYTYGGSAPPREAVANVREWRGAGALFGDEKPVSVVSWVDAVSFCGWLSEREGLLYRLPNVAEWQRACRCGDEVGPRDVAALEAEAWCLENSQGGPHRVGRALPNEWGLYDMLGNVWEWTNDIVDQGVLDAERAEMVDAGLPKDAVGGLDGTHAWFCGGGFINSMAGIRCGTRGHYRVDVREPEIGFRIVCVKQEGSEPRQ